LSENIASLKVATDRSKQLALKATQNKLESNLPKADVAELVDALDLGSSAYGVRVRVSSSASTSQSLQKY
jgi:hypothetical protein